MAHARVRVADDGRCIAQLGTRYIYAGCLSDVDVDAGCLSDRLEGDGQGHSSQQHGVRPKFCEACEYGRAGVYMLCVIIMNAVS